MPEIAIGTVCYKTRGREAGKRVVVLGLEKESAMAIIGGREIKTKKCNLLHLWPTTEKIDVTGFKEKAVKENAVKKEHKKKEEK